MALGAVGALGCLAGLEAWLRSPAILHCDPKHLLVHSQDQVTQTALSIRRNSEHPAGILFFGGSAQRESLDSEIQLGKDIAGRVGETVSVLAVGTRNQSFAETRLLWDYIPKASSPLAVAVLAVNPWMFTFPVESPEEEYARYWLLPLPRSLGAIPTPQHLMLWGVQHYLSAYWHEHAAILKTGRLPETQYNLHPYDEMPAWDGNMKSKRLAMLAKERAQFFEGRFGFHAAQLSRLVGEVRARGYTPVWLETPRHADLQGTFASLYGQYFSDIDGIAAKFGVSHLDFQKDHAFGTSAFYDLAHLRPSARPAYRAWLVAELGRLVRPARVNDVQVVP